MLRSTVSHDSNSGQSSTAKPSSSGPRVEPQRLFQQFGGVGAGVGRAEQRQEGVRVAPHGVGVQKHEIRRCLQQVLLGQRLTEVGQQVGQIAARRYICYVGPQEIAEPIPADRL